MDTSVTTPLCCPCCTFSSNYQNELVRHYVKKHSSDPNFEVQCSVCFQTFGNMLSLRSHFSRKHKLKNDDFGQGTSSTSSVGLKVSMVPTYSHVHNAEAAGTSFALEVDENTLLTEDPVDMVVLLDSEDENELDFDSVYSSDSDDSQGAVGIAGESEIHPLKCDAAQFLMSLREEAMISQSALNEAVVGVSELFTKFSHSIKDQIMQGVDFSTGTIKKDHIETTFSGLLSTNMFEGLTTKKAMDAYFKSNGDVLEVDKVTLSSKPKFEKNGQVKDVEHNAFVTQLIPTLQKLLSMPDVLDCVENPYISDDDVLRDYHDGDYCRNHPILSDPSALGIILCYDDLEVSSPLGPRKLKLALYYWTLANLHPHLRSSLKSINLYGIALAKDLKQNKIQSQCPSLDKKYESHCKILESFLKDIKLLEKGVCFNINGKEQWFKGTLLCVTGDSPAVAVLAGCKESVGPAHKPCHACHVDHHEMKAIFDEGFFQRRTMEGHSSELASLTAARTQSERNHLATLYGINGPPVISGLDGFDFVNGFVFDAMHVIHEGVLAAHMRLLLDHCVNGTNIFKIESINTEVAQLASQILTRDKPASIDEAHLTTGLRQTASQMLNLALLLPFVLMKESYKLGDRLKNFVLLLQITNGILSFEVSRNKITVLQNNIRKHHETFMVHYPDFQINPKFHYMLHLPAQILLFGPTRVTWSMRFEAMHSYFKNLMRIIKNFKNPPLSLTKRYCNLRYCQMVSPAGEKQNDYFDKYIPYGVKTVPVDNHPQAKLLQTLYDLKTNVKSCTSISCNKAVFSKGSIILYSDKVMNPTFAEIKDIILGEIIVFIVAVLNTVGFDQGCNAFKVTNTNALPVLLFQENMPFCKAFPKLKLDDCNIYIIPKYHMSQIQDNF